MYVCMHVCTYVCMYVCMCLHMYMRTYVCMYVSVYGYMDIWIYGYMYLCMYGQMCIYVCMYKCLYEYAYICTTCICGHVSMCTCIHVHNVYVEISRSCPLWYGGLFWATSGLDLGRRVCLAYIRARLCRLDGLGFGSLEFRVYGSGLLSVCKVDEFVSRSCWGP